MDKINRATANAILAELWEASKHPSAGKDYRLLIQERMGQFILFFVSEEDSKYKEGWNDGVEWCCGRDCQEDTEIAKRTIEKYLLEQDKKGLLSDMIIVHDYVNWLDKEDK